MEMKMTPIEQRDQDIESVLKYVYDRRCGYMNDLNKLNKPQIVEDLLRVGMLSSGNVLGGETFAITRLGMRYYETMKSPQRPFLHRLFQKVLSK